MKRNFQIFIPKEKKGELKKLAEASGMTMSQYVEAVLNESIKNKELFNLIYKKREEKHLVGA